MNIYRTIIKRRTIRRFKQKLIPLSVLKKLVNAARLAPSAANLQPLEFIIINKKEIMLEIFTHIRWAAYIAPEGNPPSRKQPTAYIIVLVNTKVALEKYAAYDVGAAVENIILSAWEIGIGCCWMKSIDSADIAKILKVPANFSVDSVVALGYRDELPIAEPMKRSIKYYKDKKGTLHVPKRPLKSILHHNIF